MGVVTFAAASFVRMQKALLPPGRLWRLDSDSMLSKILEGSADELVRVSGRAVDLVEEADPQTSSELLPDFEREMELSSDGTDSERQARIVAHTVKAQRFRPADVISALVPWLGSGITMIEISRANAIAVGDDKEIYRFYIYRNPADPGSYDVAGAQTELDKISHSHTKGQVIESTNFIAGSATSLVGRDTV